MSFETKNKVVSSFVTTVVMTLLLLLLYVLRLYSQVPPPEPKKMILIELTPYGGGGGGGGGRGGIGGFNMPTPENALANEVMNMATQNAEDAPEIASNSKPANPKKDNEVAATTEPKPEPGATYSSRKGSSTGSGSGTGHGTGTGSGSGSGSGSGTGMGIGSGDGAGIGSGRGIGYGTGIRNYVNIPDVNINENGTVYVLVHVTAQGNVINADIISTSKYPTTITNTKVRQECISRALSAKYSPGKEELRIIEFK